MKYIAPTEEMFFEKVESYIHNEDSLKLIRKAYDYAYKKHEGQFRKSGEPYFVHIISVAYELAKLNCGPKTIVGGLLHDVLEDCGVTKEEFLAEFDEDIYNLDEAVTKIGALKFKDEKEYQAANHRKIFIAMAKDIRVILIKLVDRLHRQNAIIPRSVFSHFVGADSDNFDDFSARQFALFDEGSRRLQAAFEHKILRHMDNSAGIEHFPERQMDMCRLGLGLYGVNPRDNSIINNVSSLKTTILQLREVTPPDTIGYSRRGTIGKPSVIAAIPIGYADGLDRHLGNRHCYCLVNGQKAEYVGNICMDVAMIDVTGIDCHEGDSVEIFGDNLPVTVLSDVLDTIPYEVLTGISNRVKRIYFQD